MNRASLLPRIITAGIPDPFRTGYRIQNGARGADQVLLGESLKAPCLRRGSAAGPARRP
jgi:hypothetical protein